jgi:hypothetical protein
MWLTVFIEQDVPGLDVTMQNAVFVRVMNGARHFGNKFYRAPDRHGRTPDYFVKLPALDELHAEVALTFALTHLVDGNNAWMFETGSSFRLSAKALQVLFARPLTKANDL